MRTSKKREELINYYLSLPYTVKIMEEETGGFHVEIEELPGCMSYGDTLEEAYKNIKDAQKLWIKTALENGKEIPLPRIKEEYSGRILIRIPKSLHKKLVKEARKEGISLNQYILYLLSERHTIKSEKKWEEVSKELYKEKGGKIIPFPVTKLGV
ncbi:type II toxin-antitoxin system HicB family antitoxin [Candidatus Calescamantes bacterium]|nr:type II toxin-antitoxin system HicB family antitoxin [Candidatus Calescamantes bacterium]